MMRTVRRRAQRGNAILFSLLIMGSAMTASMGMATLVVGEISNVSLIPQAERAYYKAESFVEQGLWQKKQDPKFHIESKDDLLADFPGFLCSGNCFATIPRTQATALISYQSTTSIPDEDLVLAQDKVVQLDIDTSEASGASGRFNLGSIEDESGLRGVEVTVIAYPKGAPFTNITDASGVSVETPVFVETRLFRPSDALLSINLGPPETNRLGERFPSLSSSYYRLRIKALGAGTKIRPTATEGLSNPLKLLLPDFRVQSVAEDGRSRRGIEVLVPATEQIASIFDFVIFSDLALSKTDAKQERTKSLKAKVYEDANRNCVRDASEVGMPAIPVSVGSAYNESTDADGIASFPDVQPGSYNVSVPANPGPGMTVCNPRSKPVSFADDSTTELKEVEFLVQPPRRVPLYRFWSTFYGDHFYTIAKCTVSSTVPSCAAGGEWNFNVKYFGGAWFYEGIQTYVYNVQVPGTQPLYRMWHGGVGDHFYTMSLAEYNAVTWYTKEGVEAYLAPYTGSCPAGTVPLYRTYNVGGTDHFYTTNEAERNGVIAAGFWNEGVTGCAWPTGN